jgi:hypothetical protein
MKKQHTTQSAGKSVNYRGVVQNEVNGKEKFNKGDIVTVCWGVFVIERDQLPNLLIAINKYLHPQGTQTTSKETP